MSLEELYTGPKYGLKNLGTEEGRACIERAKELQEKISPITISQENERYYVRTMLTIENMDNECKGTLKYVEEEITQDAKAQMLAQNGSTTQEIRFSGIVSEKIVEQFKKLDKSNNAKECKTYADYLICAIIIAFQFLKSDYQDIRRLGMKIASSYDGKNRPAIVHSRLLITKYICEEQKEEIRKIFEMHISKEAINSKTKKRYFAEKWMVSTIDELIDFCEIRGLNRYNVESCGYSPRECEQARKIANSIPKNEDGEFIETYRGWKIESASTTYVLFPEWYIDIRKKEISEDDYSKLF